MITPEGCASILWRDGAKAPLAAEQLKLRAPEVFELGIVDKLIDEPLGGAHRNLKQAAGFLKAALSEQLSELQSLDAQTLVNQRYEKFRNIGEFSAEQ